jgi:hypothetical protein
MSLVCCFGDKQQVVTAKIVGRFPVFAIFVQPTEDRIVASACAVFVQPDNRFDLAEPDFMNWFCFHKLLTLVTKILTVCG